MCSVQIRVEWTIIACVETTLQDYVHFWVTSFKGTLTNS